MAQASNIIKWILGSLEILLGIPVLGGAIILGLAWTPLIMMLVFHIVGLIIAVKSGKASTGHILGIITNCIGFIPVVGMIMHIITAVIIMIEAGQKK